MMTGRSGKRLTLSFLFLFPVAALAAEDAIQPEAATITVRVWDRAKIEAATLDRAKQVTEDAFQGSRIEIRWVECPTDPTPQNQRCISPAGPNDISVRICRKPTQIRQNFRKQTAGLAVPSPRHSGSGFVQVFFDRLEEIYQNSHAVAPLEVLLGITIAHEIGHLLLPENQHSQSGILQGCLGGRNLQLAAKGWLRFTQEERLVIGQNVLKYSNSQIKQLASLQHSQ